jgi:hypothetical protein
VREVATGVGNMLANKGGTVMSLSFHHLTLCFVNSHLAAHQGTDTCSLLVFNGLGLSPLQT